MSGLDGKRVLVVDDEAIIRLVVSEEVEDAGAEVVEAGDGQAALELIERGFAPDALVTDVRMPRVDGWALAERARERLPGLPVLYVTGYSDVRHRPVPGSRLIQKPFRRGDVSAAVERLIAEARAA